MGELETFLPLAVALVAFSFNVALQVLLARFTGMALLNTVFAGFALGFGTMLILQLTLLQLSPLEHGSALVLNTILYGTLGYGYFHFLNLGETARRIRILREFQEAGGSLTLGQLKERYNAKIILDVRMARLLRKKQLREENGRYFIGLPQVLWMSYCLIGLKKIYLSKLASEKPLRLKTRISLFL